MSKSSGPAKLVAIICVLFGLVAIGGGADDVEAVDGDAAFDAAADDV